MNTATIKFDYSKAILSEKFQYNGHQVKVMRIVKENTSRVFFYPVSENGNRIISTLFATKSQCDSWVRAYLKAKFSKA